MKSPELLDLLDRNLDGAAAKGARAVDVSAFKQMVASLRKIVEARTVQAAVEEQKRMQMSFENWLETNKQRHEWQLEAFRSVIQSGQSALKSCVLINGGAAVALLAFVGHLVEQAKPAIPVRSLAYAMTVFVGGVFAGGLASGITYLSQWFFADDWDKTGLALNIAAIVVGLASLACFCWGGYLAYTAIVA
jgi:hypothetical protein